MNSLIYADVYYMSNLKKKKKKEGERKDSPLPMPMPVVRVMYDFKIRHWLCMNEKFSRKPSTYNQKGSFLH